MSERLEQYTIVDYDNGIFEGTGSIVGVATQENPIVGRGYIVEDISGNVPNSDYPYTTMVLYESQFEARK